MSQDNKIINKIVAKNYIRRYIILSIVLFISAINYNLFLLPFNIVTGGTNGIGVIFSYVFDADPSLVIFLISITLALLSLIFLDKEDTIAATFIAIVYPLFVKVTTFVVEIFLIDKEAMLLVAIAAGIIGGVTSGIIYKIGLNTGGFGILAKIFYKKKKISVSLASFIINMCIVVVGGFIININMIFYAAIVLYISKIISEKLLVGISQYKMFYIISEEHNKIKNYLIEEKNHDVTVFDIKGKYQNNIKKSIMVVVPTFEYTSIKEEIQRIDKNAFVIITDNYEAKGQDEKIRSVKHKKKSLISRIFQH